MSGPLGKERIEEETTLDELIDKRSKSKLYADSVIYKEFVSLVKDISHYIQQEEGSLKEDIGFIKYQINSDLSNQAKIETSVIDVKKQLKEVNEKVNKAIEGTEVLTQFTVFSTISMNVFMDIFYIKQDLLEQAIFTRDPEISKVASAIKPAFNELRTTMKRFNTLNVQYVYYADPKKKEEVLKRLSILSDKIETLSNTIDKLFDRFERGKANSSDIMDLITGNHPSK